MNQLSCYFSPFIETDGKNNAVNNQYSKYDEYENEEFSVCFKNGYGLIVDDAAFRQNIEIDMMSFKLVVIECIFTGTA